MDFKRTKLLFGLVVFLLSTITYILTMPPSISFWDSGELVAAAYTFSVPHPPGDPFWLIFGKFFTLIPFGSDPAYKINIFSSICSGLTILFLFFSISMVIKNWKGEPKSKWDLVFVYGSAIIGSLSFAFCDSFWSVAGITDIYSFSTLVTSLNIWLLLYWWENAENIGSEKILILISFIIGLSLGLNLILAQISLALVFFYYFKKFEFSRKTFTYALVISLISVLLIYPVIVIWFPSLLSGYVKFLSIENSSIIKVFAVFIIPALIIGLTIAVRKNKGVVVLGLTCILFVLLGYSTYTTILLRAKVDNLPVDVLRPNEMNTLALYVSREQFNHTPLLPRRYSDEKIFRNTWTNYSSDFDFLWRYQVNHMFTRYLGWQFIGKEGYVQDAGIDFKKFYAIPLFIGLFGLFHLFRKNWKFGLTFLLLFLFMGLLSALYLRQQDPQPRERDFLYTSAFLIFSLWIGIGVSGLIELIVNDISKNVYKMIGALILVLILIFVPVNMFRTNLPNQNKTSNYVPYDFAYNMLQSIDKNGILFTNGDNDTYPLWYVQSLGFRQDVRVINLVMLNNKWYIKELKNSSPYGSLKIPINLTDEQIEMLNPVKWSNFKNLSLTIPEGAFPDSVKQIMDIPDKISWKMPATLGSDSNSSAVKVNDLMILDIIRSNNWVRPIYFSNNVSDNDCIGLKDYLVDEGLARKLVPYKDESDEQFRIDDKMFENFMKTHDKPSKEIENGFCFRGLGTKSTFFDEVTTNTVQNYRTQYLKLAYSFLDNDSNKVKQILDKMEMNLPHEIIPIDYKIQHDVAMLYARIGDKNKFSELSPDVEKIALSKLQKEPDDIQTPWNPYKLLLDIYDTRGDYKSELDILYKLERITPESPEVKSKIDAIKQKIN